MDVLFEDLLALSATVRSAMDREGRKILMPQGLSPRHAPYLCFLNGCKNWVRLSDLSRAVRLDKANTSRVVRDLVRTGNAVREENESGRVRLSDSGNRLAGQLKACVQKAVRDCFSVLSEEEQRELQRLICKVKGDGR